MLVTQGEVKQGQPGSNSPELTRGSSPAGPETAEGLGIPPSGDQMAGGGHLRDAGTRPRRVVAAVGPGMAGVITGVDLGGRRSSGELGVDATVARVARAGHLRALRGAGRELSTTAGPIGGRRYVGDEHKRWPVRASKVRWLRCTRARTVRGERISGSRRVQRSERRARGRTGAVGVAEAISSSGGWGRAR